MKRLVIVLAAIMLIAVGCQTAAAKEATDDIVITPAGWMYRANVQQAGITNPWPPINVSEVALDENTSVYYRAYIETKSGETRNNLVNAVIPVETAISTGIVFPNVTLSTSNVPTGIAVKDGGGVGAQPGRTEELLVVNVSKNVKPGEYTFDIGLVIDGNDYGQLPCTINVTK